MDDSMLSSQPFLMESMHSCNGLKVLLSSDMVPPGVG
jgi:hypothetical protein